MEYVRDVCLEPSTAREIKQEAARAAHAVADLELTGGTLNRIAGARGNASKMIAACVTGQMMSSRTQWKENLLPARHRRNGEQGTFRSQRTRSG